MKKNVLIFPAGTEIASEIFNALKYAKDISLYGGASTDDHAEFIFSRLIKGFPYINEERAFVDYLNTVIAANKIDCVYPAHDSVSVVLSKYREEIGAQVIIADYRTTSVCRSKKATYELFADRGFVPKTYEDVETVDSYPVFIKPCVGQGSVGAKVIRDKQELLVNYDENSVICEYLQGAEYTVDCFTDGKGDLLVTKLRTRDRTKAGISTRSRELSVPDEVKEIANIINHELTFKGAWFFQLKKNAEGRYKLLEISPRIPGTMGVSRNMGINFPLLTLYVFWGMDISVLDNNYGILVDRAFYNAYRIDYDYEYIYIDFDDTLTINGKVNPEAMRFLYQARNGGKKIMLLSRHDGDLDVDMKKAAIPKELFDKITVIDRGDKKHRYIEKKNAIFIDDSFSERRDVHENCGIPVFDVDMIEALIEWKDIV
ncbi:MAG: ATP-grasp domain-containing protein [Butyrivibrio sp.]|nr:ATP-grasp domain-containing protein [Butyrivibrio sp.]